MEIQQFHFAFRSEITWNCIFEASNYRRIILIFSMSEEIKIVVNAVTLLDSFATVIWSRHAMALSPTGNGGRSVTRPNKGCKGDYSKRGNDAFYFCLEVFRQQRQ